MTMEKKCKHENGWLIMDNPSVFVFPDGRVSIGFQHGQKQGAKLRARCNRMDCKATRNIYIKGVVVKWGKIKNWVGEK